MKKVIPIPTNTIILIATLAAFVIFGLMFAWTVKKYDAKKKDQKRPRRYR